MVKSKLFNIRCDNCGAEYRINSRGEMNCPFCGSKIYLNDKDFEEYQKARDEMLVKDKVANDIVNSDGDVLHKWFTESQTTFETANGKIINCKFVYVQPHKHKTVYIGRHHVTIVYDSTIDTAEIINNVDSIQYPSADIKGLRKFLPEVTLSMDLKDNKHLLVFNKPENVYPLSMVHGLDPRQVAWMISRMENLGCLFEFSKVDFRDLTVDAFYFNPKTHEIYLLDSWENALLGNDPMYYLQAIRRIALDIIIKDAAPKACLDFLQSFPAEDAYADFQAWDDVIERGFNGHKFHHFSEAEW